MQSLLGRLLLPALTLALVAPGTAALAAAPEGSATVQVTSAVREADGGLRFVTERTTTRARGLERVRRLRTHRDVVAAEVASPVRAFGGDPLRGQQWGLTRLSAEQTWQQGPAQGRLVAVVDTGVDATHPDLAGITASGLDLIGPGDGRTDPHGHGTHVAGVVAALAGNDLGGAGLAQGARILPVRALADDGSGYDSDVAEGVVWAVDHGAAVVNLSLGGPLPSSLLTAAISYAHANGVVVVAASGNDGAAGDPVLYPAATPGVIAVGAVATDDQRPDWSSSGQHLALAAPGVGIVSTVPGGYASWDGTSMAAPFVAAAAALLVADEPALTPADVRTRLMSTARDLGPAGHDAQTGAGMVDVVAARAVSRPATLVPEPAVAQPRTEPGPGAPPALSVSPTVISAGQRVTVTYSGTPGAVVDVLSRTQPATVFTRIATVTLDATGTATSTHAPQKNTRITVRSAAGQVSAQQPLVEVRSVASLTVQRTGTLTYVFTGRVYPALDRRLVNLYRSGVLLAQGRTDARGVYAISRRLPAGTATYQVRTANDTSNLGTAGPGRAFRAS